MMKLANDSHANDICYTSIKFVTMYISNVKKYT